MTTDVVPYRPPATPAIPENHVRTITQRPVARVDATPPRAIRRAPEPSLTTVILVFLLITAGAGAGGLLLSTLLSA